MLFMTNCPSTSDPTRRKECEKKDNLRCCSCADTAIKARVPSPLAWPPARTLQCTSCVRAAVYECAARQTRRRGGGNAILMLPRHQNKPQRRPAPESSDARQEFFVLRARTLPHTRHTDSATQIRQFCFAPDLISHDIP